MVQLEVVVDNDLTVREARLLAKVLKRQLTWEIKGAVGRGWQCRTHQLTRISDLHFFVLVCVQTSRQRISTWSSPTTP